MTDFEINYAVMALLYLMECCVPLPEHSVLFTRFFSRWRVNRFPGCAFVSGKRLALMNPLPWAGEWHVAPSPDATVTDQGVITLNSLHDYPQGIGKPRVLKLDDPASEPFLQAFAAAGYLVGEKPVVLPFDREAGGKAGRKKPPAVDPGLARWTDSGPVREALVRFRSGLFLVKILCTMLFLWAFAGAPLLLQYFSLEHMLPPYLFVLFWLSGTIAASFARIYRRAHGRSWKAFGRALWLFVYPLAAMRAAQSLCGRALPPRHESAVAEALMSRKNPQKSGGRNRSGKNDAAAAYLADITVKLRHRLFCRSLSAGDSLALAKANERLLQAVYANWGVDQVPPLHDGGSLEKEAACYCPVCGISMAVTMEYCPHCLEVKTLSAGENALPPSARAASFGPSDSANRGES